jgi:hypothetical protein
VILLQFIDIAIETLKAIFAAGIFLTANMTAYIPSITLPAFIFERPAAAILLPLTLGNAIGYSTRRKSIYII